MAANRPTPTPEVVAWLKKYEGNFSFYLSLRNQFEKEGWLSELQQTRIVEAMKREANQKSSGSTPQLREMANPTYPAGTVVEVKKWLAERIAKHFGLETAYRNLEIKRTFNESAKAVQVEIKLSPKIGCNCSVCGQKLDTEVSRATGIGPVCADRLGIRRATKSNAQEILKEIESRINSLPAYGPLWVPRSQIKGIVGADVAGESHWQEDEEYHGEGK